PLAALSTLRRRARPGTTVFARGMASLLPGAPSGRGPGLGSSWPDSGRRSALAEQPQHARLVGIGDELHARQLALADAAHVDHAVAQVRVRSRRLPGAGHLEALGRGAVGLLLGHRRLL